MDNIKPFVDISIFSGITQYYDLDGVEWRQVPTALTIQFFSRGPTEDCFMFQGELRKKKMRTDLYTKHSHFLNSQDD